MTCRSLVFGVSGSEGPETPVDARSDRHERNKGRKKTINCVWDLLFDPQIPPEKFMWAPFVRLFPRNEAHKPFSGGPK